jgi:hypothetical protein
MFGIGVLWAAIWAPLGLVLTTIQFLAVGVGLPPVNFVVPLLISGLLNGFATGFLFSGALSLLYRRRTFDQIRVPAVGLVGALVGVILPAATILPLVIGQGMLVPIWSLLIAATFSGGLGAATAVGLLKVAQAAPDRLDGASDSPNSPSTP